MQLLELRAAQCLQVCTPESVYGIPQVSHLSEVGFSNFIYKTELMIELWGLMS